MLSTISYYFLPAQVKSNFLDQGIDPAQKDNHGFSPIDYAVFESQAHKLPQLFEQGDASNSQVRPQHSTNLQKIINQKAIQNFEKTIAKIGDTDLDNPNSSNSILLEKFVNSDFKTNSTLKYSDIAPIHLLALFAKPAVLEQVIAKYPELLEVRDSKGNTPLHYAAFNKDEHLFVLLAKKGADVFASNSNKVTALGEFVYQIQAKDPIRWQYSDLFIFMSSWLPTAIDFAEANGYLGVEVLQLLRLALPGIRYIAPFVQFGTLLGSIRSNPKKFFFTLAFFAAGWIPAINLPYKAYMSYSLAKRALNALTQAYKFNHKPITASVMSAVKISNAYDSAHDFYTEYINAPPYMKITQSIYNTYSAVISKWEEFTNLVKTECGPTAFNALRDEPEYLIKELAGEKFKLGNYVYRINDDYSIKFQMEDHMKCALSQFETTYDDILNSESKNYNPDVEGFYRSVLKPFAKSYSSTCLESAIQTKDRFECLGLVGEDLIATYYNINKNQGFSNGGSSIAEEAYCQQSYQRPAHLESLASLERLRALPHPAIPPLKRLGGEYVKCVNIAMDILGLKNLCDKNAKGKPSYEALYKKLSLVTHPDRNQDLKDASDLSQKVNAAKEIIENAYTQSQC